MRWMFDKISGVF